MASPALGAAPAPATPQNTVTQQKLQLEQALKGSASWFVVIAGLSLVNSVLAMTGAGIQFIFGLGFTQVVDAIAHEAGSAGFVLDFIVNGIVAGVFVLFWNFSRKGQKWAWITGMGLYVIDALIVLLFKDFLAVAFHAWALYRMSSGYKLLSAFERMNRQAATGTISSTIG